MLLISQGTTRTHSPYLWERSWDRWVLLPPTSATSATSMNGDPIRDPLHRFFSPNIRILWERIHWGSPSIPLLNCAIDSQGTTDCTYRTAHLHYPFHILLFWVSGLLLHNLRIQTRSLGGHLSPNALLSQYASNLGIYTQLSAHIWHTHAIKRTCLYNQ